MDPLALALSCSCVDGVGQRRYDQLAAHLERMTGRSFKLTFEPYLDERASTPVDIGLHGAQVTATGQLVRIN